MVTSLPRIHVAVMGDREGHPVDDRPRWCSSPSWPGAPRGRSSPSYTTLVRGPRRAGELEGPEEFHLILLDNGRVAPDRRARCARRSTACAAAPASTSARSTARSAATPTATRTRAPSASSSPRCSRATASVQGSGPRLVALRGVQGRLPGADRHPAHAGRAARAARPGEDRAVDGAGGVPGLPAACSCRPRAFRLSAPARARWLQRPFVAERADAAAAALLRQVDAHARPAAGRRAHLPASAGRSCELAVTTRAEFLGRIRAEVAKTPGLLRAPPPRRARPRPARGRGGRAARAGRALAARRSSASAQEFERVAGVFHRVADAGRRCPAVDRAASRGSVGARSLVTWDPAALGLDLGARARRARGLAVDRGPRRRRTDEAARAAPPRGRRGRAELGVTGVDLALAETGTLILLSGAGRPRSTSLLPAVHVAVFDRDGWSSRSSRSGSCWRRFHVDPAARMSGAIDQLHHRALAHRRHRADPHARRARAQGSARDLRGGRRSRERAPLHPGRGRRA